MACGWKCHFIIHSYSCFALHCEAFFVLHYVTRGWDWMCMSGGRACDWDLLSSSLMKSHLSESLLVQMHIIVYFVFWVGGRGRVYIFLGFPGFAWSLLAQIVTCSGHCSKLWGLFLRSKVVADITVWEGGTFFLIRTLFWFSSEEMSSSPDELLWSTVLQRLCYMGLMFMGFYLQPKQPSV